ncbi:MAG TPA: acyltransferase [Kofleriaceae bacterium]|nr:acyltransferase [Kofleriaceae bacterium]
MKRPDQLIHPTAVIDGPNVHIGADTRIWHFTHVMAGAYIGDRCSIAQNCFIGKVRIGHGCKIQNNVSVYDGVTLEDDVFLGPSCVFTNVMHPRAHVSRKDAYARTLVCKGATIGANATILCGITIGEYAMIGAGAVVTRDVPPHAIVTGSPGRRAGWACRCGETLRSDHHEFRCRRCGEEYAELDGLLESVPAADPGRTTQKTLER